MLRRLLGSDSPADLLAVGGFFVVYVIVERLTAALAVITIDDLDQRSLMEAAIQRHLVWWVVLFVVSAAAVIVSPGIRERAFAQWSWIDHGAALRWLAAPLIVYLAWQGALYPYNYFAGQVHLIDRALVVALAAAALWRPIMLVPFALQFRVILAQTLFPFQTAAAQNVDDLLVIVLLLIGAGHLLFVLTGRRSTSAVVLGIGAVLAAHFYLPGKGKLDIGWLTVDDVANLPLASYTAGWLGDTDGSVAVDVASVFDRFGSPIKFATLVLEVGSLVAAAHRRLLRPFLVGWVGFHIVTFVVTGFFFLGWVIAEIGLLMILGRRDLRAWVDENATWARAAVAVAAVVGAPVLFHPPGLAWIDAPVSYGYRLQGVGQSGTIYPLPASAFAPLDHEIMFKRVQFDGHGHLSGAYGALESADRIDELNGIENLEDLSALESARPEPDPATRSISIDMLTAYMTATNDDDTRTIMRWLNRLNPPSLFWSSRTATDYGLSEPITSLDVTLVTQIHDLSTRQDGVVLTRAEPLITLTRQPDGTVLASG